ncbi:MAG: GNAT family N-acetyltransferase [Planctomycetaceae bacterium]
MLETRAFDGTPEELSDFVVSTWKSSYDGTMAVPNWSADYFRWQLRLDEPDSARRVTAVYSDGSLAGTLIFCPFDFELRGVQRRGAHSSWLSVSPNFRRLGVGKALQAGAIKACQEDGVDFRVGYVYQGARKSQGPMFWLKKGKPVQQGMVLGQPVGFWARVIDADGAIAWNVSKLDRVLTRLAKPFIPTPKPRSRDGVEFRRFEPSDAEQCVTLANESSAGLELRIIWTKETLGVLMQGFGEGIVATKHGEIQGFIAFHNIVISGLCDAPIGVIDVISVDRLSSANRAGLLDSVVLAMKESGAVVALKQRTGDYPSRFFARLGWAPRICDSQMVFTWCGEPRDAAGIRRCHVLWR